MSTGIIGDLLMFSHGCPCQKVRKELEERYWLYKENFKEYPHQHVSQSECIFSLQNFLRFPNTYK